LFAGRSIFVLLLEHGLAADLQRTGVPPRFWVMAGTGLPDPQQLQWMKDLAGYEKAGGIQVFVLIPRHGTTRKAFK
jgi:hypothetical protein